MKVISFSLYGSNKKYTIGMLKNIDLVKKLYPEWKCYIYYNETVPIDIVKEMKSHEHVKLINMTDMKTPGMFWRFLPNDDNNVDYFIVRDSDSRINEREVDAVNEWLESGKKLHIMRDHPHHNFKILGGMWGLKSDLNFNFLKEINKYNNSSNLYEKMTDMDFLRDIIYPKYVDDSFVHASSHKHETWAKDFNIEWDNYKFIGEIYNADDSREYQYKILKK